VILGVGYEGVAGFSGGIDRGVNAAKGEGTTGWKKSWVELTKSFGSLPIQGSLSDSRLYQSALRLSAKLL
jgi:hypothetical protein